MWAKESRALPRSLGDMSLVVTTNWDNSGPRLMFSTLLMMFTKATVAQENVEVCQVVNNRVKCGSKWALHLIGKP
jgi:hypothetical protein